MILLDTPLYYVGGLHVACEYGASPNFIETRLKENKMYHFYIFLISILSKLGHGPIVYPYKIC